MSESLRVGLIGCGRIGRIHLAGYRKAGVTIAAVADVNPEAAQKLAAELGCAAYTSVEAMLAEARLDAVSVATPPAMHRECTVAAARAGVPALCEKPLAESLATARLLQQEVEATGTPCMVGFFHRFHEPLIKLRELLAAGDLGAPVTMRSRFSIDYRNDTRPWIKNPAIAGGGAVIDVSMHSLDILRFASGGEITGIQALTATFKPGPAVEDTALMLLEGEGGNLFVVESYSAAPFRGYDLWVQGTAGEAVVGWDPPILRVRTHSDPEWREVPVTATSAFDRFDRGVAYFVDCVRRGVPPELASLADGVQSMALAEAAYKAAATGERVSLA